MAGRPDGGRAGGGGRAGRTGAGPGAGAGACQPSRISGGWRGAVFVPGGSEPAYLSRVVVGSPDG